MPPKKQAKAPKRGGGSLAALVEAASSTATRASASFDTVVVNGEQVILNLDLFDDFKTAWKKVLDAVDMPNLATAQVQLVEG